MPLTPKATGALLAKLGHTPKKKLGQNFLIDGNTVRKSLKMAEVSSGDVVVEVGPGLGTLSRALLDAGATLYAVEKDPTLAANLQETLVPKGLNLLEGDAVEHPLAALPDSIKAFKIVANLPYAITTPWLEGVLERTLPTHMVLMLQKEAADRYVSTPGTKHWGAIAIFLQAAYESFASEKVSRKCFYPEPGVDSVLLGLKLKEKPYCFQEKTRRLIRHIFTQRRKRIGSLPKRFSDYPELAQWIPALEASGVSADERPEGLGLEHWLSLDAYYRS